MDLNVSLKLDASAFEAQLSKSLAVLRELEAQGGKVSASVGNLDATMTAAAETSADVATAAEDTAKNLDTVAEAADKASSASESLSLANEKAATETATLSDGMRKAQAGAGALGGAFQMASGSVASTASGAVACAKGLTEIGFAAQVAVRATLVIGLIASAVLLLKTAFEQAAKAEGRLVAIQTGNLASGINSSREAMERYVEVMDRAVDTSRALAEVGAGSRSTQLQTQLYQLEAERNQALQAARENGGNEDAVQLQFDERRNALQLSFDRGESARRVETLQLEKTATEKKLAEMQQALDEAMENARLARAKAAGYQKEAAETTWTQKAERLTGYATRYGQISAEETARALQLRSQLEGLQSQATVLEAQIAAEGTKAAMFEARAAAESSALSLAKTPEKAVGSESEAEPEKTLQDTLARGSDLSDRLARIGGFVGGSAAANLQKDQLAEARQANRYLAQIAGRATSQYAVLG